jgi:hypothetical protein
MTRGWLGAPLVHLAAPEPAICRAITSRRVDQQIDQGIAVVIEALSRGTAGSFGAMNRVGSAGLPRGVLT